MQPATMDHNYHIFSGAAFANAPTPPPMLPFDRTIVGFMREQGIPGASITVGRDGKLIYQQGYGSAGCGRRVQPSMLFRIASISKVITAAGILRLLQDSKISLEDKVFGPSGILHEYNPKDGGDSRLTNITIRHLLHHSAGWDRDRAGDAVFWKIGRHTDTPEPVHPSVLIEYMMRRKLQFAPGKRHAYSNLGYTILGEVIERVSGECYEQSMEGLLNSVGIDGMKIGRTRKQLLHHNEVEYFHSQPPYLVKSIYPDGGRVPPQYGRWTTEEAASHGGWIACAPDLLAFLHILEGRAQQQLVAAETFRLMLTRPHYEHESDVWYGMGLDVDDGGCSWGHSGQMEGTSCVLTHHHSGFSWALLFNSWAKDLDLDGLVKCALSEVVWQSTRVSVNVTSPYKVITSDRTQVIQLPMSRTEFCCLHNELQSDGYHINWVNVSPYRGSNVFNGIWIKANARISMHVDLSREVCMQCLASGKSQGLRPLQIETYVQDSMLCYAVILADREGADWTVRYDITVAQHRKHINEMFNEGYDIVNQCLTEFKGRLHVTTLYEKVSESECVAEFDIKPEHYMHLCIKQAQKAERLSYVKAYTRNEKPRFSVIWSTALVQENVKNEETNMKGSMPIIDNTRDMSLLPCHTMSTQSYDRNHNSCILVQADIVTGNEDEVRRGVTPSVNENTSCMTTNDDQQRVGATSSCMSDNVPCVTINVDKQFLGVTSSSVSNNTFCVTRNADEQFVGMASSSMSNITSCMTRRACENDFCVTPYAYGVTTKHNMSRYGALYELREGAEKNRYVRCVSSYLYEDALDFVIVWED